ncbi:MAG: GTP cyclohydrolase I, partial [Elusimicrobiaceae bacterium]|nr:GTP cyclohydrolase I [Elusimicrobiaceae bacterium]
MPKINKTKTKPALKRAVAQVSKNKISEEKVKQNLREIITYIGENPAREGLLETPKRIVKSWDTLFSGYKKDPAALLKTFTEGSCEEMVILKDIEFYSTCEHHFAPFFGTISIGYLPNKKVIGISKLARLVEVYARRL